MPVEVRCFGEQRVEQGNLHVRGFRVETVGIHLPETAPVSVRRGRTLYRF